MYQDFDFELPIISDRAYHLVDTTTGEYGKLIQSRFQHEGSHSSFISISISGNRISISGNPSKFNRLDNFIGLTSIDQCVSVYNSLLENLGLPLFTKCTKIMRVKQDAIKTTNSFSDGAKITRIDITENIATGKGNTQDYIAALSTLNYRHSVPHLYTDCNTVDWKSVKGNTRLIYPSVYNKAHELKLHTLSKFRRKFGIESKEYKHIQRLIEFCIENGVARFEQKLKHDFLKRENLQFWGLSDYSKLKVIHKQLIDLDKRLQVTSMDLETISEKLISEKITDSTKAANTTAMYAYNWFNGQKFDLQKSQVKIHRARLNKIGVDIGRPCNVSRFTPVYVKKAREVMTSSCAVPTWYELPSILKLAS